MPRCALVLLLATLVPRAASAGEASPAELLPRGATLYVEGRDLAGHVRRALDSPLGANVRSHPAMQAFLRSPEGRRMTVGLEWIEGITGRDLLGNLDALVGGETALAVYGGPQRAVLLSRVDPAHAGRLLADLTLLAGAPPGTVVPAAEGRPALQRIGRAWTWLDGDLLAVATDDALARAVHAGVEETLASDEAFVAARATAPRDALLFAHLDLEPFRAALRGQGLPRDFGQALLGGALPHRLRDAPWAAASLRAVPDGDAWSFELRMAAPRTAGESEAVRDAYAGTLGRLPFAVPERTVALVRLHRSLPALWSNREALVDERGIPGMIEFETNFANLTSGMGFLGEFLPHVGDELIVVGTRPLEKPGEPQPGLRLPDGALVWPLVDAGGIERTLRVTFYNVVGIVNAQGRGLALLPGSESYRGVRIDTARYGDSHGDEAGGMGGGALPMRYNFAPSMAIVEGHLVVASSDRIVRQIVDVFREGPAPAPGPVNAGVWIDPGEARRMLARNREALVARTMLAEGLRRDEAERRIDLFLELSGLLRELSLTAEESEHEHGVRLHAVLGAPAAAAAGAGR